MPELGDKFTCADCETKYYDLGRPDATCPKCGSANRVVDDDLAAAPRASRSRSHAKPVPSAEEDSPVEGTVGDDEELDLREEEEAVVAEGEDVKD